MVVISAEQHQPPSPGAVDGMVGVVSTEGACISPRHRDRGGCWMWPRFSVAGSQHRIRCRGCAQYRRRGRPRDGGRARASEVVFDVVHACRASVVRIRQFFKR